jgi:hypothetical protein
VNILILLLVVSFISRVSEQLMNQFVIIGRLQRKPIFYIKKSLTPYQIAFTEQGSGLNKTPCTEALK